MEISRVGLGLRIDMARLRDFERHCTAVNSDFEKYDEAKCVKTLLERLLSAVKAGDVSGLRLYGGHFKLDEADDENIYTVVFMNGSVQKTRKLFLRLDADVHLKDFLDGYRPYIQTNVLNRAPELIYFGEFDKSGALCNADSKTDIEWVFKKTYAKKKKSAEMFTILLTPDKFKGSMSSKTVAKLLADAAVKIMPGCRVLTAPIADGGEGTVETMVRAYGGEFRIIDATAPNGGRVRAKYGMIHGTTAVIETAAASGLCLVPENERDPFVATSRGTGELMVNALNEGAKRILVGLGGSATNDGGMGAAVALGAKFFDSDGNQLHEGSGAEMLKVKRIDLSGLHPGLKHCEVTAMCDVENPMTGSNGAAFTFGWQKGADEEELERLEAGMKRLERLYNAQAGREVCSGAGCGAAGGMGAMLAALLGAKLTSGAKTVLDAVGFDELLEEADAVVTGEGMLDASSAYGKAVGEIVKRAQDKGIPAYIIAGCLGEGYGKVLDAADANIFTCVNTPEEELEVMDSAECAHRLLTAAAEKLFKEMKNSRNT